MRKMLEDWVLPLLVMGLAIGALVLGVVALVSSVKEERGEHRDEMLERKLVCDELCGGDVLRQGWVSVGIGGRQYHCLCGTGTEITIP